ncbi:gamma-glutamylcyclotransferase family protein [Herbiconiux liukaitaii]|uniref:gamma-glutamylcyclotransferase family protein n=1 Tax=Herbiconiux liukaitaii TaxID=3342799 RepID=UPI0035BB548F
MSDRGAVLLFSYGTLQLPEVQRATFGRLLTGRRTAVVGYRLEWLTITDPHVIATSGTDRHPLLVPASDTPTAPAPHAEVNADVATEAEAAVDTESDAGIATQVHAEAELDARAEVEGTVFEITADELAAADAYEVDDYRRVLVPLATGEQAWVYVYAGDAR